MVIGTIGSIICFIVQLVFWYVVKAPFNLHSSATWFEIIIFLASIAACYAFGGSSDFDDKAKSVASVVGTLTAIIFMIFCVAGTLSGAFFHSRGWYEKVSEMVTIIDDNDPTTPNAFPNLLGSNNDTSNLPLIGVPEAIKNSETQMGRQPALGSQFELLEEEMTSQSINNSLMYVIPLEPKSMFKWNGENHGYFIIDRNNGNTEFVQESLKTTEKAPFGDNAKRIIYSYMRKNGIGGRITELSPEINEEGEFMYVATVYKTKGVEGFDYVTGVVELNAKTQECQYYALDEIPEYIDRVFPEWLFNDYITYYGEYKNGWWNTIIGQKEVLEPTNGSDIVYIDGVCWYYTGFTSAGKGESSNGIIMMNCRTGEIEYHKTYGISEDKAQGVAEGRVQEKEYKASYPLLLMVGGQETYFMLMRDNNNNLCGYSFVNYKDYSKASVAESLVDAQNAYIKSCSQSISADVLDNLDVSKGKAAITHIGSETKEGNTIWYIRMDGNTHIFSFQSSLEPDVVFAKVGDVAEVTYIEADSEVVSAISIDIKLE